MRLLGVGLVYWVELDSFFDPVDAAASVLELEPESFWEKTSDGSHWRYQCNDALLARVASLPQAKLLHGVGQPFGGTVLDPVDPLPLLRHTVERLDPAWVSEHLSFNRIERAGRVEHAGFLLPPSQSPATVKVAAHNIGRFRRALERPVAFETGVNYLAATNEGLDDGEFFSAVALASGSGILLDLHNLWCNERNGRQSVAEVLAQLPLNRVWELHFAGGMYESGYWLDAHSGAIPSEVIQIAADLVPRLPNLGALIFEILPQHLPRFGHARVEQQLAVLHELWKLRPPVLVHTAPHISAAAGDLELTAAEIMEVSESERSLANLLRAATNGDGAASNRDSGYALLFELITDFRRANLARAMHYTLTALLAGLGILETRRLLEAYFASNDCDPFGA
jgi:uncharacterized protein (UPF0276 family)